MRQGSRTRIRRRSLIAGLLTAAMVIAACGDGGEAEPPPDGDDVEGATEGTEHVEAEGVEEAEAASEGLGPDEPLRIGFTVPRMADEVAGGAGAEEVTHGDMEQAAQLLIDQLNADGGIAGRQIEPVFHEVNVASPQGLGAEFEAACTTFTQDHDVFAVIDVAQARDPYRTCLEQAGVLAILHGLTTSDAQVFEAHPHLVELSMRLDRVAVAMAEAVELDDDAVVGVAAYDAPTFERAAEVLEEQLAANGVELAPTVLITEPQSEADLESVSADVGNAVLRFKDAGVTDVLFMAQGGALPLFFMLAADQQDYAPAYLLTSHDGGQVLVPSLPPSQLESASLVSWSPVSDVGQTTDAASPARDRCLELMASGGLQFPDPNAEGLALGVCDGIWLLQAALDGLEGDLTPGAAVEAIEALGGNFESPGTFATQFGPDQRDGVAGYRIAEFDVDCSCFRYTSELTMLE